MLLVPEKTDVKPVTLVNIDPNTLPPLPLGYVYDDDGKWICSVAEHYESRDKQVVPIMTRVVSLIMATPCVDLVEGAYGLALRCLDMTYGGFVELFLDRDDYTDHHHGFRDVLGRSGVRQGPGGLRAIALLFQAWDEGDV